MIMRDSVTAADIPENTPVVAGYGDGRYAWSPADWARFPNAVRLSIVVDAAHQGDVLDVERGDAVPGDVPGWCDRFSRPRRRAPTVYCNRATWPACRAAAGDRRVDWWISTLDGTIAIAGAVAVQHVDTGPYDESIIIDGAWAGGVAYPLPPALAAVILGGAPVTMDTARALIWLFRLILFGAGELGEANAQGAIDNYASKLAAGANPEGVLTAMLTDAQKDYRLLAAYRFAPGA